MIMMDQSFMVVLTAAAFFVVSSTGSHTLQYSTDVTSQNSATIGELDREVFVEYSSSDAGVNPKTEWIKKIDADVPGYWESEKARMSGDHGDLQHHLRRLEEILNQTKGAHTLHRTYRCELSDDDKISGSLQFLYEGKVFIRLHLNNRTWTADDPRAEHFWEFAEAMAKHWTNYLNNTCIRWLQQYLKYSSSVIQDGVSDEEPLIIAVVVVVFCIFATAIVICKKKCN